MPKEEKVEEGAAAPKNDDQLKLVNQNLESMSQLVTGLMQKVAKLEEAPVATPTESAEPPVFDASGLEEMSREQFAQAMLGQFQTGMEGLQKDFSSKLDGVVNSVRSLDASSQVKEAAREHTDFWDWRAEMKTLSDKHPTMSASELYQTARAANPERAKELDTKYQPPTEPTPSDGNGAKEGKSGLFGGFQPSTVDTPAVDETMTFETAAEKAWQENMAGLSDVLNSS